MTDSNERINSYHNMINNVLAKLKQKKNINITKKCLEQIKNLSNYLNFTTNTKELLRKIYQFFVTEKEKNKPWALQNPIKRLVKATGIKPTTLQRYVHTDASDDAVQDVVKAFHKAAVQKTVKKNQKLDDFDKGVVRRTIYDLHKKSQSVTMPSLQQALKKKDIDISISTVSRTVRLLGFRFYKNASSRRFVSEREDIVLMRMTYLRKIHVGSSQQGLIPGCGLIFESKTNSSDYHDEMNKEHFTEWFRDTLLPKLPPRSVIIMDNAPYHSHLDSDSRVPNTSSNKSEISAWLEKSIVQYDKKMKKTELLDLVK
ncbi:unnamed protein product [Mytilus coruscus]|uniref:Tc1-like transposase DDE domain-containing protein n=1 Tax=Mytilus coruscus TaxID=42192 RepID=A0A6J7ZUC8_MYTCO|nr:unnamed protein product [Mytilus coruscus]